MSERESSGEVEGRREESVDSGKRRKHFPGEVRPARPALWVAEARDSGTTRRASIPVFGLNIRSCEGKETSGKVNSSPAVLQLEVTFDDLLSPIRNLLQI